MSKTMAAFYEDPPYLEAWNRIQRQIDSMTQPLLNIQQNYAALTRNLSAVLDSPAIQNINRMCKAFDCQSMSALYRTQEIIEKIDTSGMMAALRQYQATIDSFMPKDFQTQLSMRLEEWSRVVTKVIPCQIEPLTEARIAELTRLSSLAEEYTRDFRDESGILSEGEQELVAGEVEEILHSGKNWDQRFAERMKILSQTHPSIVWVLVYVFLPFLISIIANIASSAIGQALSPANIYEEPHSSSQVVYHIELKERVVVIGDAPYYYEVEIHDESSGNCYTGYVSKRSISLMESEEK